MLSMASNISYSDIKQMSNQETATLENLLEELNKKQ